MAGLAASGPLAGASTVGTGSTAGRRISSCRRSTTTTTPCSRPATTRAATTSAWISRTGRSSSSATCARSTPSDRSSATSRRVRVTRRITRPPSGSRGTRATSTRVGTCGATPRSRASSRAACFRPARNSRRGRLGSPRGRPRTRGRGRCRPLHGVLRGAPRTPTRRSRACRVPRGERRPRQHAARAVLRQRREQRGRRAGIDQRRAPVQRRGAGRKESRARIDEIGGPTTHNNYPWGWTMAGNTPFKRWKREVHEGGVADPCIIRLPAQSRTEVGLVRNSSATRSTCSRPCSS